MKRIFAGLLLLLPTAPALAHVPGPVADDGSPRVVLGLIGLAAVLYLIGLSRLWPHARRQRDLARRSVSFLAGCIVLALLLVGPLDEATPTSFAVHMLQHEGLMLIAAPLLVLGRGLPLFLWALPHGARRAVGHWLQRRSVAKTWGLLAAPLAAWLLHAAVLWGWHAPRAFDAALRHPALHELQHASFFLSALLFWHALIKRSSHAARGLAVLYLLTTTIHTGVLGAFLTLTRDVLYASNDRVLSTYLGLTPLEDQQLGGLIMWVPASLVYVGFAMWLLSRWIASTAVPEGSP